MELTRRRMMLASAAGAAGAASTVAAVAQEGGENVLTGGDMALSGATNVSGKLWIGPKAARSDINNPQTGSVFMASDVQVEYHYDGDTWVPMGVGSAEEAVPSINSESASFGQEVTWPDGTTTTTSPSGGSGSSAWLKSVRAVSYVDTNGDYVCVAAPHPGETGEELYRGSDAALCLMHGNDALAAVDGTQAADSAHETADYSAWGDQSAFHWIATGDFVVDKTIVQRGTVPMMGYSQPGAPSNVFSRIQSNGSMPVNGSLSRGWVLDVQDDGTTHGWAPGPTEDSRVEGLTLAGANVDDTVGLIRSHGQDRYLAMLELRNTAGPAIEHTGTTSSYLKHIRIDNVGDSAETPHCLQWTSSAGTLININVKSDVNSPDYLLDIGGSCSAHGLWTYGQSTSSTADVYVHGRVSATGIHVDGGGSPVGVLASSFADVTGARIQTGTVGLQAEGRSTVVSPSIQSIDEHGVVHNDEATIIHPHITNVSQASANSYDGISTGGRSGGLIFAPEIVGNGDARHGIGIDANGVTIAWPNEIEGLSGNQINLSTGDNVSIWDNGTIGTATTDSNHQTPRYNGVIAAGPFGGASTTNVSGVNEGDRLLSDGSSGETNDVARSTWYWDATNSQWLRALDSGTATVSPA